MNIIMTSKTFYHLLKQKDKNKIKDNVELFNDYETLKKIIIDFEMDNDIIADRNYFNKLLINNSFYSFPTQETIHIVFNLIKYYNFKKYEEMCCGNGLFSELLKTHCIKNNYNLDINISDSMIDKNIDYFMFDINIKKRSLQDLVYQNYSNITMPNFVYMANPYYIQTPEDEKNDTINEILNVFIETNIEMYCIIIDKNLYKQLYDLLILNNNKNYNIVSFYPKNITCSDFFVNNPYIDFCNSQNIMIIMANQKLDISNIYNIIGNENILNKKIMPYTDTIESFDYNFFMGTPLWILKFIYFNLPLTHKKNYKYNEIINTLSKMKNKHKIPPNYILKYEHFKFWEKRITNKEYPKNITSYNIFLKYYNTYNLISSSENNININELIIDEIIPSWVINKNDAYNYLYVLYSVENKEILNNITLNECVKLYNKYK